MKNSLTEAKVRAIVREGVDDVLGVLKEFIQHADERFNNSPYAPLPQPKIIPTIQCIHKA